MNTPLYLDKDTIIEVTFQSPKRVMNYLFNSGNYDFQNNWYMVDAYVIRPDPPGIVGTVQLPMYWDGKANDWKLYSAGSHKINFRKTDRRYFR
jgi:hypothetical protein